MYFPDYVENNSELFDTLNNEILNLGIVNRLLGYAASSESLGMVLIFAGQLHIAEACG